MTVMVTGFVRRAAGWTAFVALALVAPAAADSLPSYATGGESIHGTIVSLPGKYALLLGDERGFTDNVTLHDGTVIAPSGVSLEPGQEVTILGHTDGKTFDADEIDTDGSDAYDSSGASAYVSGGYDGGAYPPYVLPLGGGGYYYGNGLGYGGYGGGYYYSSPGYSSSQGAVTANGATTPVYGHPQPIAHPPIARIRQPAPPTRSGPSFGSGATSHAAPSHASSRR